MYPDESSLSRSVLFASHNMVGWHIFISLSNDMYLYDKIFYTLAYPFACLVVLYVILLLLWWSSIIDVSKCERCSRSTGKGWFRCIVYLDWTSFLLGFFPRVMTHVLFWLLVYYQLLLCPCTYFCIGIVVCLVPLLSPFEQLYGVRFILQDRTIIFLCDTSLIRVIN